jgi:hypothetical protein
MTTLTQNQIEELDRIYPEWRSARPLLRMQLVNKLTQPHAVTDADKVNAVLAQSDLQRIEARLAKHIASPPPRFANGISQHEKTTAFLQDRAAGIRRRLATAS